MRTDKQGVVTYINELKGYEGYVQFSDTKIRVSDIFIGFQDVHLEESEGFVYEANFFNGSESISIKQLNADFYIDVEKGLDLSEDNTVVYESKLGKVRMVQIWEDMADPLCDNMQVSKLKKVLFAGFVDGGLK